MRIPLAATTDTETLAVRLARCAPSPAIVYLHGDLGAGKSTLARAWLRHLGVQGAIKSPTYTLIERYPTASGAAAHLDLYRIAVADELDFLGLDDLAAEATLWLVEWPEHGGRALPAADLHVHLAVAGQGRAAELSAGTSAGQAWLTRIASDGALLAPS